MARHRKLTQKFTGFPLFKLVTGRFTYPLTFSFSTDLVGLDRLSLDLQFAIDKTLTARTGPTPVFTRGSTATFVGSNGLIQSAAVNTARFDHDPITLACKGLLIEESRTNVALYSGALVNGTGWSTGLTSVVDGLGPDGNSAYELSETTANSGQTLGNFGTTGTTAGTSVVSGINYTGSIFLKRVVGNVNWVQITFGVAGFGLTQYANINLLTGTIGNSSGGTARIEAHANGWYRVSWTAAATATTTASINVIVAGNQNTNGTTRVPAYSGSTSNKFLATMAQFEAGSFATSYIPTVASSVVRSADVCSITGSDFTGFYNPVEGSFATSQIFYAPPTSVLGQLVFDVNDTTVLNRTRVGRLGTSTFPIYLNNVGGTQDVAITGSTTTTPNVLTKFACCMKANDFALYLSNVLQGVDTSAIMQSSPTTLTIGNASSGVAVPTPINGTILSIRYYRKRLDNTKLQALTV